MKQFKILKGTMRLKMARIADQGSYCDSFSLQLSTCTSSTFIRELVLTGSAIITHTHTHKVSQSNSHSRTSEHPSSQLPLASTLEIAPDSQLTTSKRSPSQQSPASLALYQVTLKICTFLVMTVVVVNLISFCVLMMILVQFQPVILLIITL